jgi:hypothetical protein
MKISFEASLLLNSTHRALSLMIIVVEELERLQHVQTEWTKDNLGQLKHHNH